MAEKNRGEQPDDLETGNTNTGSSSMNTEITKESACASTPTEPPPTSVNKENTTPNDNSKSKGGTGEDTANSNAATTSESCGCLVILLVLIFLVPAYFRIKFVRAIAAPKKWLIWVVLEWIALVGFTGFFIASLTRHNLKNHLIWELELWKWCILLMVVVCGKLISQWIVNAVFLLISLLFANNLKVSCFAYGLKQKNRVFVWWGLVLIAWLVLVIWFGNRGGTRSEETKMILDYVTRGLISLLIGAGLWLAKDLLLWSFAHSFQSKNFFHSILKAKFYKFVIETCTLDESSVRGKLVWRYGFFNWEAEIKKWETGKKGEKGKNSVFSIKLFIDCISGDANYKLKPKLKNDKKDREKDNDTVPMKWGRVLKRKRELDRKKAAKSSDPKGDGSAEDSATSVIPRFSKKDKNMPLYDPEVDMLFKLIGEIPEGEKLIKNSDCSIGAQEHFNNFLEIANKQCDSLRSSLDNTRRGMEELNQLAKGIVLVLILIVWLLMMKILSTQAVALILSQFFVLTFVFGDTCKRIFEGIVFAYVIHPFNIGDRCLIEDREEELVVKEINIQTTVFSRDDPNKEEIVYPNSALATKHICNFHNNPKLDMTDSVEFVVDASTISTEQIDTLNSTLKDQVRIPWIKEISVRANDLASEHGDTIKMGVVHVTHNYFPKDDVEKSKWKSQIALRLKQILDMTDSVEFVVDASTISTEQIDTLNSRLKDEIKGKSPWIKDINVHANGFEVGDKIKMGVYVTYKYFGKDNMEKSARKSKIVLGLKRILEDVGISKYPKKNNVESAATGTC